MKYLNILKLADDFEKRLKEQAEKEEDISFEEAYLLSLGAIPVGTGKSEEGMSFLGKGFFSKVYRVIFNGKPAAAKISYSEEDIEAIEKLDSIKSSLPSDVQKHILNVYKIKYADNSLITEKFKSLSIKDRGLKQVVKIPHVAIVEELEPLSSDVLKTIFTYYSNESEAIEEQNEKYNSIINNLKNNLIYLKSFVRGILISKEDRFKNLVFNKDIFSALMNEISQLLLNYNFPKKYIDFKEKLSNFSEIISNVINIVLNYKGVGVEDQYLIDWYARECRQKFYMFFLNLKSGLFPRTHRDENSKLKIEILKNYPEVKSLVKLLDILQKRYNIYFRDLSSSNLMQRKNKDIVISDPGLFEFR